MQNLQRGEGMVSNILAVAGFIILIAIIVWGAFHFLSLASSGFSSLFSRGSSTAISVSTPGKTVTSGQPLDITWKFSPPASGTYAFLYQCKENFQFKVGDGSGGMMTLPCGAAYTIAPSTVKTTRMIPVLLAPAPLDVPFSIIYMQSGTSTGAHPQGNAMISVLPPSGASVMQATSTMPKAQMPAKPVVTYEPTYTQTQNVTSKKSTGLADLSVQILAVGVIDPATGMFVERNATYQNEIVAVQFDIKNVGGTATGPWNFSAELPTSPMTPYIAPLQRSLNPGDHIVNTLRFDEVAQGGGMFKVSVDPANSIHESNKGNNTASEWLGGGYAQPYPQPYGAPYQGQYGNPYQY